MKTTFDTLDKHIGMIGGKSKLPSFAQEALDLYKSMVGDAGEDLAKEIIKETPEVNQVMEGLLKSVDDILNKPQEKPAPKRPVAPKASGLKKSDLKDNHIYVWGGERPVLVRYSKRLDSFAAANGQPVRSLKLSSLSIPGSDMQDRVDKFIETYYKKEFWNEIPQYSKKSSVEKPAAKKPAAKKPATKKSAYKFPDRINVWITASAEDMRNPNNGDIHVWKTETEAKRHANTMGKKLAKAKLLGLDDLLEHLEIKTKADFEKAVYQTWSGWPNKSIDILDTPPAKKKSLVKSFKKAGAKAPARKTATKANGKPKAITTRNVKTPDLTVLTRFNNLPKQRRTYKSIAGFLKQVENGLAKKIYLDHRSIIETIASKLKSLVGKMSEDQEMDVTISDTSFMEKVSAALATATPRLQVNFLAGLNAVPEVDWDFLEENHPNYYGSDRIGELTDLQDYLDGEKTLKEIGYSSKKEALAEYKRLGKMVMNEAKGLSGKK